MQTNYQVAGKQTCILFLLPTASSFLITSLFLSWGGGDAHGQEGGCTGGGGGMHVHPVHPPWVRPWVYIMEDSAMAASKNRFYSYKISCRQYYWEQDKKTLHFLLLSSFTIVQSWKVIIWPIFELCKHRFVSWCSHCKTDRHIVAPFLRDKLRRIRYRMYVSFTTSTI